jgi:hypothetical protein
MILELCRIQIAMLYLERRLIYVPSTFDPSLWMLFVSQAPFTKHLVREYLRRRNTYHILHCHLVTQLESPCDWSAQSPREAAHGDCGLRGLGVQLVEPHIASFHRHRLLVSGLQVEAAFRIALNQKQSLSSKSPPNLLLLERLISGGTISLFGKLVNISAFTDFFAARISLCIISYPISYI